MSTVPVGRSPFSDTSVVKDFSVVQFASGVGEPVREGSLEGTREPTRVGAREGLREACEGALESTCVEDDETGSLIVSNLVLDVLGEGIEASSRSEPNVEGSSNFSVGRAILNE